MQQHPDLQGASPQSHSTDPPGLTSKSGSRSRLGGGPSELNGVCPLSSLPFLLQAEPMWQDKRQGWARPWSAGRSPESFQGDRGRVSCGNGSVSGGWWLCVCDPAGAGLSRRRAGAEGHFQAPRAIRKRPPPARQAGPTGLGEAGKQALLRTPASTPARPCSTPHSLLAHPGPQTKSGHSPFRPGTPLSCSCLKTWCVPTRSDPQIGIHVQTHFVRPRVTLLQ